jgi:hypothetical protein
LTPSDPASPLPAFASRCGSADAAILALRSGKDDPVRRNSVTAHLIRARFVANFFERKSA